MDIITILDIISTAAFLVALILTLRIGPKLLSRSSHRLLILALFIYVFVGFSNILEHGGITAYFDFYEDYMEMFFLPIFIAFGYSVVVSQEVRKREITEAAFQESKSPLYRSLVENIDLGVTLIDGEGTIVMANAAQARMLGRSPGELAGKKCFEEFEKMDHLCRHCPGRESMVSGKPEEVNTEGVREDGSRFRVRIRAFPVMGNEGRATGFIEVVEDITDRLKIEEEIRKTQKLESIGILAGGIAHDFNNLLTGILGNISLAKTHTSSGEEICQFLDESEKASERARTLTQQLLTFSSGGMPITQTSSITRIIRDSAIFVLSGSNVNCEMLMPDDLWSVEVDEGQVSQVIQNIVKNADQAMPDGGTVQIRTENLLVSDGASSSLGKGRYVKIEVADHGTGISGENLSKVFDPYFTTKKEGEGSGLGLAVSYSIIKNHHGLISVESEVGAGTTFSICLPASSREIAIKEEAPETYRPMGGRILLMDDEEVVRKVVKDMLEKLGCQVELTCDGDEAVEKYRQAREAGRPFDAVIMDLTIPGGMGGKQAVRELLKIDDQARVIVSSGYANDPIMADFRSYGFQGVVPKPYTLRDLNKMLTEVLSA